MKIVANRKTSFL